MISESPQSYASDAADISISGRIMQIREIHTDLRTNPATGSFAWLKKIAQKSARSIFTRQSTINSATVDLIEAVYREVRRTRAQLPAPQLEEGAANPLIATPNVDGVYSNGETMASCGQTQDQAKLNNIRQLHGFNAVYSSPAEMRMPERVALYSLIFGMQPRNCLEIGSFRGGSSAIICGAMNDTGFGQLTCIEPSPRIEPELWAHLSNRCRLFEGLSPNILPEVSRQIGEPFDFALIDASHEYACVRRDITGVLPYLTDSAYILFHDANYPDVKRAIDEALTAHPELTDCGMVSVEPTVLYENGQRITWAGLRLLKFQRRTAKAKVA